MLYTRVAKYLVIRQVLRAAKNERAKAEAGEACDDPMSRKGSCLYYIPFFAKNQPVVLWYNQGTDKKGDSATM
jgi:hypothetical protein